MTNMADMIDIIDVKNEDTFLWYVHGNYFDEITSKYLKYCMKKNNTYIPDVILKIIEIYLENNKDNIIYRYTYFINNIYEYHYYASKYVTVCGSIGTTYTTYTTYVTTKCQLYSVVIKRGYVFVQKYRKEHNKIFPKSFHNSVRLEMLQIGKITIDSFCSSDCYVRIENELDDLSKNKCTNLISVYIKKYKALKYDNEVIINTLSKYLINSTLMHVNDKLIIVKNHILDMICKHMNVMEKV